MNKRKKNSRLHGSHTHGYGAKKKHRGSGSRGGFGLGGTGKRADSKKPSFWKEKYFGKYGFVSKNVHKIVPVNIDYLQENIESLTKQNLLVKDKEHYKINLTQLGYNKLLGKGTVCYKWKIEVPYASKSAIDKIKQAGGEVSCLKL